MASREADQDLSHAKDGPVEQDRPANALKSNPEQGRRTVEPTNILDALPTPGQQDIEFELPLRQKALLERSPSPHRFHGTILDVSPRRVARSRRRPVLISDAGP
jgi:hypothetical protein